MKRPRALIPKSGRVAYSLLPGETLSSTSSVPFDFKRFLTSTFTAEAIVLGCRADAFTAVVLWMESFRQDPAGTLPNDDLSLARLAGFGADLDAWIRAKPFALYGWSPVHVTGTDHYSYLYHPLIEQIAHDLVRCSVNETSSTEPKES